MSYPHPLRFRVLGVAACLLGTVALPAQTEDDTPPEVITLPEFTVTTSAASEYVATESITGTRVATVIRDLPFTVNVVTGDFMDDFAALEFRDQFGYTSSISVWETLSTGYSVRGFDANVQLRNGFRRIGLIDKVNVERAEVIKGPAASIYGTVLPGGTINIITRKPQAKPEQRVSAFYGSNNLRRARLSSTGPTGINNVFYRVDFAVDENDYDAAFKHKSSYTAAGQLLWKIADATSFHIEYEMLKRYEDAIASTNIPFTRQSVQDPYRNPGRNYNRYTGLSTELPADLFPDMLTFNIQGPKTYSDRWVNTVSATFEHRLNDTWTMRSAANWFERELVRVEVGSRDRVDLPSGLIPRGTPRIRPFPEQGMGWQTDFLASWETGSVKHKTLLTVDFQRQEEQPERSDMFDFDVGMPTIGAGLDPNNPVYDFVTYNEDPSIYALAQKEDNTIDLFGIFGSHRMTFLNERALVMTGVRVDWFRREAINFLPTVSQSVVKDHEISYQIGANFRVLPSVTAFTNLSRSFVPQFAVGRNEDGTTFDLPPETGTGWEVGIKTDFFEGNLTFTAIYYDIERNDVARDAFDADTGLVRTYLSGSEGSKGFELDFNYVATKSLQFFGGFGYNDTEILENVEAPHLTGSPLRRAPQFNVGLGYKYTVKEGTLRGLYLTGGMRYFDKSLINPSLGRNISVSSVTATNPFINNRMPNGRLPFEGPDLRPGAPEGAVFTEGQIFTSMPYGQPIRLDDGRESIFNRSHVWFESGVGYRWRSGTFMGRNLRHSVQLNVRNLGDKYYTYGSAGPGPQREFILNYDVRW